MSNDDDDDLPLVNWRARPRYANCGHCDQEFEYESTRWRTVMSYCSESCKIMALRRIRLGLKPDMVPGLVKRTCRGCGEQYDWDIDEGRARSQTCKPECQRVYEKRKMADYRIARFGHRESQTAVCISCKKPFDVPVKRGTPPSTCSETCRQAARDAWLKNRAAARRKQRSCLSCGEPMPAYDRPGRPPETCSQICKARHAAKKLLEKAGASIEGR